MRLAPFLLAALTAVALIGASPARCLAGMPVAPPHEATPETPPCHEAPAEAPADAPRPAVPVGATAACCAAPATAPDAPARLAAPVVAAAVVWTEPEARRPSDVSVAPAEAEPPDRWGGPIRVMTGCFRM